MNPYRFKLAMGTADNAGGRFKDGKGQVTENVIMRLAFHDCIPYMDGTGIPEFKFKVKQNLKHTYTFMNRWM